MIEPLRAQLPERCVADGELVIAREGRLDFDALQLRIHPAASRVKMLAGADARFGGVLRSALCVDGRDLRDEPFTTRRAELEAHARRQPRPPIHITPATRDRATARDWFHRFEGAGLDGVVAKSADGRYQPDKRVMLKIKHERDCDCVVAGFRWYKDAADREIGSLLLGLYNDEGALQHVGVCASFSKEKRRELLGFLTPYRENALDDHPWKSWAELSADPAAAQRMPGAQSRWSQGKDLSWEPLRPELVVEVAYEHMQARPLPAHGAIPPLAHRQAAVAMHLRATGSGPAGRIEVDLRAGAISSQRMFHEEVELSAIFGGPKIFIYFRGGVGCDLRVRTGHIPGRTDRGTFLTLQPSECGEFGHHAPVRNGSKQSPSGFF